MKRLLYTVGLLACTVTLSAQAVADVILSQEQTRMRIDYALSAQIETYIYASRDSGRTYVPIKQLTGNYGSQAVAGRNTVYWDALGEWGEFTADVIVKVVVPDSLKQVIVNDVPFSFVYVQGGTYTMGATEAKKISANDTPHRVTVSSFYIGVTEVTQQQWQAVMADKRAVVSKKVLPISLVSYEDARLFVQKMSQLTGLHIDIPTEAEWEFAARGGIRTHNYRFAGSNKAGDVASLGRTPNEDNDYNPISRVAGKDPNEIGLYDMTGNVLEWCRDWYGSYDTEFTVNPEGPAQGEHRVARGGSWRFKAAESQVYARFHFSPANRMADTGLRIVMYPDFEKK